MPEREWPKTFGVDPTTGDTVVIGPDGAPTKIPAGEPMIPAALGWELCEALKKEAEGKVNGPTYKATVEILDRYEREVQQPPKERGDWPMPDWGRAGT